MRESARRLDHDRVEIAGSRVAVTTAEQASAKERHVGREDFAAAVGDEDVVLDPDAAEVEHSVDTIPVDRPPVLSAPFLVLQQSRNEVDPGLDREAVTGFERQVDTQLREARSRAGAPAQHLAGIANSETDHVADPVRKEERHRAGFDEGVRNAP